ncbi:TIGR02186 family protein [Xanthobacter sp. V2C-8]|uniref:TIGR02186 family protein n=1 Tax=Xanthobacter albus TaxID=3119929 RepID=UPI00372B04EA
MSAPRPRRRRALLQAAVLALALACGARAATAQEGKADRLVVSVSQPQVRITSTFTGAELVVFGVAETAQAGSAPDVVVTVRGPKQSFVTWRKSRVLGLWVNADSRTFIEVPAFLSVQASRPVEDMAPPEVLRVEQIGLSRNVLTQLVGPDYADVVPTDAFRLAFLRTQEAEDLYQENPNGVTFLAPRVFRANLTIPGRAPIGRYDVSVKLLREGRVTAQELQHFEVNRTGFEQEIASFSHNDALIYGIVVAIGSLIIGFIGNFLFRKE